MGSDRAKADDRLYFLVPSAVALCFSIAALLCYFGSSFIDMHNSCYYIAVSAAGHTEQEFLDELDDMLADTSVSGYTVQRSSANGYIDDDGRPEREDDTYFVILLDVDKSDVMRIAQRMTDEYHDDSLILIEFTAKSYFVGRDFRTPSRADGVLGGAER